MTANMKSGLFCQKCVNKHGNTSSEGHNSILHDKCSEKRQRRVRISHKISEQTKFACHTGCNDPTQTIFFFFFLVRLSARMGLRKAMCRQICTARKEEGKNKRKPPIFVNQQGEKKKREIFYFFVSQKTNTLDAHI